MKIHILHNWEKWKEKQQFAISSVKTDSQVGMSWIQERFCKECGLKQRKVQREYIV